MEHVEHVECQASCCCVGIPSSQCCAHAAQVKSEPVKNSSGLQDWAGAYLRGVERALNPAALHAHPPLPHLYPPLRLGLRLGMAVFVEREASPPCTGLPPTLCKVE